MKTSLLSTADLPPIGDRYPDIADRRLSAKALNRSAIVG
jgi:hypothetical protein